MDREGTERLHECNVKIRRLCLSLSEIAALTLTDRDVKDKIFTICKKHIEDHQIVEAYLKIMQMDVEKKLNEVADE